MPGHFNISNSETIALFLVTIFGAMAMHIFSAHTGFNGAIDFLKKFFPGRSEVFYTRLNFVVVVLSGSIIGWISFTPTTLLQALLAGFGWVGFLNFLLKATGEP